VEPLEHASMGLALRDGEPQLKQYKDKAHAGVPERQAPRHEKANLLGT
jgi:hypothetical protein